VLDTSLVPAHRLRDALFAVMALWFGVRGIARTLSGESTIQVLTGGVLGAVAALCVVLWVVPATAWPRPAGRDRRASIELFRLRACLGVLGGWFALEVLDATNSAHRAAVEAS
jgi:hypothetical protein